MANKNGSIGAPTPEEMTAHMLIGEITKHTVNAIAGECNAQGIALGYRAIIYHLAYHDGITQLELSRLTNLKPPTISVSLQKMEADGLVSRQADKDDLRKTIVRLTEKGQEVVSHLTLAFRACDEQILRALTDEELRTLRSLLLKIHKHINSESEENTKA